MRNYLDTGILLDETPATSPRSDQSRPVQGTGRAVKENGRRDKTSAKRSGKRESVEQHGSGSGSGRAVNDDEASGRGAHNTPSLTEPVFSIASLFEWGNDRTSDEDY